MMMMMMMMMTMMIVPPPLPPPPSRFIRHKQVLAFTIPAILIHIGYWSYMVTNDKLDVFTRMSKATNVPNW